MSEREGGEGIGSAPKAAIGLVAVLIVAVGVFVAIAASRPGSAQPSQGSAAVPPTQIAKSTATAALGMSPAKATALQQQELAQQTAVANPAKPTKPSEPVTPTPDGSKPSLPELGILDWHQSSASIRGFYVSNLWHGQIDDRPTFLQVSAGSTKADTGSLTDVGIVAVVTLAPDDHGYIVPLDDFTVYEAPGSVGPLTIASVDGNTVALTTAQGDTITFDLASRGFQSQQSSIEVAPTTPVEVAPPAPTSEPEVAARAVVEEPTDTDADTSTSDVGSTEVDAPTEVVDDVADSADVSPGPNTGIFDIHQSAASVRGCYVSNYWVGSVDGGATYLQVSAGARKEQSGEITSTGVVAIAPLAPDDNGQYLSTGELDVYEAPGNVGPLLIVDVEGTTMVLQTADGGTITFDLVSLSFN